MQHEINLQGKDLEITMKHQLIYADTTKFSAVIQKVRETDIASCVVNLAGLEHIDSSGLRMVLLLHDACKEKSAPLRLSGSRGQVRDMLLHCRFETIVQID